MRRSEPRSRLQSAIATCVVKTRQHGALAWVTSHRLSSPPLGVGATKPQHLNLKGAIHPALPTQFTDEQQLGPAQKEAGAPCLQGSQKQKHARHSKTVPPPCKQPKFQTRAWLGVCPQLQPCATAAAWARPFHTPHEPHSPAAAARGASQLCVHVHGHAHSNRGPRHAHVPLVGHQVRLHMRGEGVGCECGGWGPAWSSVCVCVCVGAAFRCAPGNSVVQQQQIGMSSLPSTAQVDR